MHDIAQRIKELIEHLALNNKDFAESIGVTPAIISHVLSGRNNPSLNLIQQITNVYTNVNLNYLLNGEGDLMSDSIDHEVNSSPIETESSSNQAATLPPGARYVAPPSGAPKPRAYTSDVLEPANDAEAKAYSSEPKEKPNPEGQGEHELTNVYTNVNRSTGKDIERIVFFYKDGSFREYRPEA